MNEIYLSIAGCDGEHVFAQATLLKPQQRWLEDSLYVTLILASEGRTHQTIRSCHPSSKDVDKHVILHVRISLSYHDWLGRRLMMITNAPQPLQGWHMYASQKAQGTSHNSWVALRFTNARSLSMTQRELFVIDTGNCLRTCEE